MKSLLIYGDDSELNDAWAAYLSKDGFAVFTSTDSLEAAEILTMIKIDSVVISSNNPVTYLILGKVAKTRRKNTRIIAVTRIRRATLELLLETRDFTATELPFMFSELKGMIEETSKKTEETGNVFA